MNKNQTLSPTTKTFILFLSKVKRKTPLEVARELEDKFRQRKNEVTKDSKPKP